MKKEIWDQVKNITSADLKRALERDGWLPDETGSSATVYLNVKTGKRVAIHFHAHKTYGSWQLRDLLEDIGWTEADLKRLKLIK